MPTRITTKSKIRPPLLSTLTSLLTAAAAVLCPVKAYNVLLIGGTRFSGASVWKELYSRGHTVTVYNRGKTEPKPVAGETRSNFYKRMASAKFLEGDRTNAAQIKALIDPNKYHYVYDMNARKVEDTAPLAELFVGKEEFKQYVFMSSAGVYLPSDEMPHLETDGTDPNSRHKGKLDCEEKLRQLGIPFCSFRPTYICGPQNYNPLERYFFERVAAGRPVCIPGHGQHITGLGHVEDLAVAFVNVIGREDKTTGQVYNVQNTQGITFDGVARAAAKVAGVEDPSSLPIVHYDPKDYVFPEGKKPFPMRPQHFFTSSKKAMLDLDWTPKYDSVEAILKDSYENDFVHVRAAGGLKNDFICDDIVLGTAVLANYESSSNGKLQPSAAAAAASSSSSGPKAEWMQDFDERSARMKVVNSPEGGAEWMTGNDLGGKKRGVGRGSGGGGGGKSAVGKGGNNAGTSDGKDAGFRWD